MRCLLPLPVLLVACSSGFKDDTGAGPGVDTADSADTSAETGDSHSGVDSGGDSGDDTGGDSGGDSGDTSPAMDSVSNGLWATVVVTGRTGGFDLDGDTTPDNSAATLAELLDPLLAAALASADILPVLQLSDVQGWTDDEVGVALLSVVDTDLDPTDNFDGDEDLFAGGSIDAEGVALTTTETEMVSGGYALELPGDSLRIGDLDFVSPVPFHLAGDADASPPSGQFGLAIRVEALLAIVGGQDPTAVDAVRRAADLDTDGDGERESISTSLTFTTVGCTLR